MIHKIQNISTWNDIAGLPKTKLRDICIDLKVSEKGSVDELCARIWEKIENNSSKQLQTLESSKNYLLGGKTSITWFSFGDKLAGLKEKIVSQLIVDPFENMIVPSDEEITSEPLLISAAVGDEEGEYYLRFVQRIGNVRDVFFNRVNIRPKTATTTVYFNEEKSFLEIRTEPKRAATIARSIARLAQQQINLEQVKIAAPYGYNAEVIADKLSGELFDARAKPELLLEGLTEEHTKGVVEILNALDQYFSDEDINALSASLESTKEKFGEEFSAVPFTALIVNGLDRIGMGATDRDLRGLSLYDFLKPHLQLQGGYIKFPCLEEGLVAYHTIRIGLTTDSVQFITPATENAISYVRQRLMEV